MGHCSLGEDQQLASWDGSGNSKISDGFIFSTKSSLRKPDLSLLSYQKSLGWSFWGLGARKRTGRCAVWVCGGSCRWAAQSWSTQIHDTCPNQRALFFTKTLSLGGKSQGTPKGGMRGRAWLSGRGRICRETNKLARETSEGIIFKTGLV